MLIRFKPIGNSVLGPKQFVVAVDFETLIFRAERIFNGKAIR